MKKEWINNVNINDQIENVYDTMRGEMNRIAVTGDPDEQKEMFFLPNQKRKSTVRFMSY